jgi:hypothetical protein
MSGFFFPQVGSLVATPSACIPCVRARVCVRVRVRECVLRVRVRVRVHGACACVRVCRLPTCVC